MKVFSEQNFRSKIFEESRKSSYIPIRKAFGFRKSFTPLLYLTTKVFISQNGAPLNGLFLQCSYIRKSSPLRTDLAFNAVISETVRPSKSRGARRLTWHKNTIALQTFMVVVLSILQREHSLNRNTKQNHIEKKIVPANMENIQDPKNHWHIEIGKKWRIYAQMFVYINGLHTSIHQLLLWVYCFNILTPSILYRHVIIFEYISSTILSSASAYNKNFPIAK